MDLKLKQPSTSPADETRREFLVKAGKVVVYTPPALMLLMHPSKDALANSYGDRRRRRRPGRGPRRPRWPRRRF